MSGAEGLEPRGLEPRGLEPPGLEPRGLEPPGLEPPGLEPRGLEPRGLEPRGLEPRGLERRYRRLLAWYPPEHRRTHEEEMLGVLLASSGDGQHRPGLAETADLILGALRIRLRPGRAGSTDQGWRDALAVISVAVPVFMLLETAAYIGLAWLAHPASFRGVLPLGLDLLVPGQAVVAILVLLRLRRTAALVALAMTAWFAAALVAGSQYAAPWTVAQLAALALTGAALVTSPGPRLGLRILRLRGGILLAIAAAAAAAVQLGRLVPAWRVADVAAIAVICVIVAGLTVASPLGRHVLLLAAIPAYPFALTLTVFRFGEAEPASPGDLAMIYLPFLAVLGVAPSAIRRARRRAVQPGDLDTPA